MSFSWEQHNEDIRSPLPELNIQDLEQMSDEEFWDYARQRARFVVDPPSHADYLECKLSGSTCLVPLNNLAEVLPPPYRLALLPGMPAWMTGIMAWRGETIAVVNLDLYLSLSPTLPQMMESILLVACSSSGPTLGLLVPAPALTTTIDLATIVPLETTNEALLLCADVFSGMHVTIPILNVSALLANLVQQIGMATSHG